jgi:stearoyl-CoA desaturase (delta-9 desaturase)
MASTTATETRSTDLGESSATWGGDIQSRKEQVALALFIIVPFLAVAAAVPLAWGGWLGWSDVLIMRSRRRHRSMLR